MSEVLLSAAEMPSVAHQAKPDSAAVFQAELRSWALLAAGSLAVAGVFALLLAISRIPGAEKLIAWPLAFFAKGLVIHVIFSLVIWFLAVFALLASMAAGEISGEAPRASILGRSGLALAAMSFPMLFLPAFHQDTAATLNNYIPVIIHPTYYLGLVALAVGIALPVLRLFIAARASKSPLSPFASAMTAAGVVYIVALICFAAALRHVWGDEPSRMMHERLFWGGGHILQFLYALLMLTGWYILGRQSLGRDIIDPDIFKLATTLIAVFSLAGLIFAFAFEASSVKQTEAFRRLQFVLALPSLLVAVGGLTEVRRRWREGALPWHDPTFVALALSPIVFGVGGIMGLLITTSDTRTPAHYHGMIAAVNLALMGLMLTWVLPRLHRHVQAGTRLRLQIVLFGLGQLLACIGLFLAGGYGAPRKTPSGSVDLLDGAVVGLYLHGIGALLAVAGGTLFVITVLRALLHRPTAHESRLGPALALASRPVQTKP